ncbi:hypothetical protein [uncultured Thalassospira sp.]|uniref:hypothetical protein n=1 Tax=uncultured Thalassospira sp. TaxID=404382 RepID=UPI0030DA3E19|tara:strand:+ start:12032 stop:12451 length:420 start_codon:yes stop_codon:yes gene_type:complete
MKTGYEVLQIALREAANDNLTAQATVTRVINDLDFAGLTIMPRWPMVDYSLPVAVIDDDADGTYPGDAVCHAPSVTDLMGRAGDLVTWSQNGQTQAEWFDAYGASSRSRGLQVVNVAGPVPVTACAGDCGACAADRRAS